VLFEPPSVRHVVATRAVKRGELITGSGIANGAQSGATASDRMTQRGSCELPSHAQTLLAIMGHRGHWDTERLCEASQLSVPQVQVALFELQMARRVTADMGVYSPV
jgi:hypothetical protein